LTNFSNGKQTQESLESGFPENEFRETNMALVGKETRKPLGKAMRAGTPICGSMKTLFL
jgi:hypothetical protein